MEQYGTFVKLWIHIILGTVGLSSSMVMFSTMSLCFILIGYSIGCLYVWTLFLVPTDDKLNGFHKLRGGLYFHTAIKMYRRLHVMTIVQSEFFRSFRNPCMHHIFAVVMATVGLYNLMLEIISNFSRPIWVGITCIMVIFVAWVFEFYTVCLVAKVGVASKNFIRKMRRIHGTDRYKRRLLNARLPNAINLEFLRSVDSIKNGIETEYFLNFLDRVTDNTTALLMTTG